MTGIATKTTSPDYYDLVTHYERCFDLYGPVCKGVDWPNEEESLIRHGVMQGLWREDPSPRLEILDIGCGFGAFYRYLTCHEASYRLSYHGVDLSESMIYYASHKYPAVHFEQRDILQDPFANDIYDYAVMNGVLTFKGALSQGEMLDFSQNMVLSLLKCTMKGVAFNVMGPRTDPKRTDLFKWDIKELIAFLIAQGYANMIIRNDYGLYEYTVYIYKKPNRKIGR